MIALALAGDPTVLIADEPTTALDVTVQRAVLDLLKRLRESRGLAVLFITHDLDVVADIADEVLVMERGVIVGACGGGVGASDASLHTGFDRGARTGTG
jgi:peptide/nickel transport system ATP-binding protein